MSLPQFPSVSRCNIRQMGLHSRNRLTTAYYHRRQLTRVLGRIHCIARGRRVCQHLPSRLSDQCSPRQRIVAASFDADGIQEQDLAQQQQFSNPFAAPVM